ncbi:MAG: hypothetical protein QOJ62_555 [Actinomycetota bacterium]|jgi:hypothetical protein|nr:hypothetical protein [Actinomycetota bacterium]
MGRGRAKAKQTKVARELKYSSGGTDLDALRKELVSGSTLPAGAVDEADADDPDGADDLDDELGDEDDEDDEIGSYGTSAGR